MFKLKERPPIPAIKYVASPKESFLSALPERYDLLVVGAAIFYNHDDKSYLLLMKRAETDSLPGKWELPGGQWLYHVLVNVNKAALTPSLGGVDNDDVTIADAVAREVKEETGLTVAWVIQEVINHRASFTLSRGGKALKLTFVVEIEEIEVLAEAAKAKSAETAKVDEGVNVRSQKVDHVAMATLAEELARIPVKLNDAEHQKYVWATEEQIATENVGGQKLKYVSEQQKQVMLEAFEIQKHVIAANANA